MQFHVQTTALLSGAELNRTLGRKTAGAAGEASYIASALAEMKGFGECIRRIREQVSALESEADSLLHLGDSLMQIAESYTICEHRVRDNMQYIPVYHRGRQSWNTRRIQPHLIFPFPGTTPQGTGPQVVTLPGTDAGTNDTLVTLGNAII